MAKKKNLRQKYKNDSKIRRKKRRGGEKEGGGSGGGSSSSNSSSFSMKHEIKKHFRAEITKPLAVLLPDLQIY